MLEKIFYYFIPYHPTKNKAQETKEKYHVLFLLGSIAVLFIITITLSLIKGKSYSHPLNTLMHNVTLVLSVLIVFYLKWKKDIKGALAMYSLNVFLIANVSVMLTGGVYSIEVLWFLVLIESTTLLVSKKFGAIMVLLTMLSLASFYCIKEVFHIEGIIENIDSGPGFRVATLYLITSIFYLISTAIVYNREKMQDTISEIKQNQIDIIDSKYRFIVENSNQIIGIHQQNGIRTYSSESFQRILGYPTNFLIGKLDREILSEKSAAQWMQAFSKSIQQKVTTTCVLEYIDKNQQVKFMQTGFKPIFNANESFEAVISSLKDITADKELEEKLAETKHQIAQDFHDEIGNKLAIISSKANLLHKKTKLNSENNLSLIAENIEQNTLALYRDFKDFIWSVDTTQTSVKELFQYLQDYFHGVFGSLSVQPTIEYSLHEEYEQFIVDPFRKKNIISICKEACSNILKHSNATNVHFLFQEIDEQFMIRIIDNGEVPKHNSSGNGMGLKNMQERAKKMGAILRIETTTGYSISLGLKKSSLDKKTIRIL